MKRILVGISLACLLCIPCHAIKSMGFNSVAQYVERADGIWITKVVKQSGHERTVGPTYEAKILQTLKGEPVKKTLTICAISRKLTAGHLYLVFGFNRISTSGAWLDNGNVSPVPIPASFPLTDLKGKSVKEQITAIMTARCKELERLMKELAEEKKALEGGLEFQKRLDKLPSTARADQKASELKLGMSISATKPQYANENPVFNLSIENAGDKDVMLNLGMMLANGKVLLPDAIRLILIDSNGKSKELYFSDRRHPGIAGRIDDYIVPLRAGSTYTLRLRLEDYWVPKTKEFQLKLKPGEYHIRAELTSKGARHLNSDTQGIKLMNVWKGKFESDVTAFGVR